MTDLQANDPGRVPRLIRRWGVVAVIVSALDAVLSYGLATFAPLGLRERPELAMFRELAQSFPAPATMKQGLEDYFTGNSLLADSWVRGGILTVNGLVLLICFVAVFRAVILARELSPEAPRLLFRFALVFAVLGVVTYPVFTTDFWLSVAWGRMIVAGQNPYYTEMSPGILEGLPINNWGDRMTYGPLWAMLSAGLAWLGSRREWLEYLLFKGFLAAAWIGSLALLRRIAALSSRRDEAIALAVLGWMPVSTRFTLGEGHNDIVMIAPLLLWLLLLARRQYRWATPALLLSVLIKYITAPLLAADFLAQKILGKVSWGRYLVTAGLGGLIAGLAFLPFARDFHFFESAQQMRNWVFWTPGAAIFELGQRVGIGIPERLVNGAMLVFCAGLAGYYLARFLRSPGFERFLLLILAGILVALFVLVGHVWPWFMLWALPVAALVWRSPVAWFVLFLAALAPFLNLHWLVGTDWQLRPFSGLMLYFTAGILTVWLVVRPRLVRPAAAST
jgi:alpha-1,6-mannosyltransferase